MRKNQTGFAFLEILIPFVAIALVLGAGFYVLTHRNKNQAVSTTRIHNSEVNLYGKLTEDNCFTNGTANNDGGRGGPIGDVGCSITVNGYSIAVRMGNMAGPKNPGIVTGLDFSKNQVGQYANVYAKQIDGHSASIWDASKYYVRIY